MTRIALRVLGGLAAVCLVFAVWYGTYALRPLGWDRLPVEFTIPEGGSLRSVAKLLQGQGVLPDAWRFELLGRMRGKAHAVKAGSYQLDLAVSPSELLDALTGTAARLDAIALIEGWNFRQFRAALDAHSGLKHQTTGLGDREVLALAEVGESHPEGLFFPDKYFFVRGASDVSVLKRAYRRMQGILDEQWAARSRDLPLRTPYEALTLASIVEKETGRHLDRPMIASVFVNRLRAGMRLQADPTVIYGLGTQFDGDLRKRDLLTDGPYNSYTRAGLPPTPIAMPGMASLAATLNPAQSRALYFVARGDGSSEFSESLTEHNRAVTKYQRGFTGAR
jgi:UPF0755 protein